VKERKGPFGLMVGGIVDSVVQTARRRAQDREPRALIYDASGRPRLLQQGDPGRDALVETGGRLIDLVGAVRPAEADAAEAEAAEAEAAEADAAGPAQATEPGPDALAAAEAETQAEAQAAGADEQAGENPA
jgi:hypothetical protein